MCGRRTLGLVASFSPRERRSQATLSTRKPGVALPSRPIMARVWTSLRKSSRRFGGSTPRAAAPHPPSAFLALGQAFSPSVLDKDSRRLANRNTGIVESRGEKGKLPRGRGARPQSCLASQSDGCVAAQRLALGRGHPHGLDPRGRRHVLSHRRRRVPSRRVRARRSDPVFRALSLLRTSPVSRTPLRHDRPMRSERWTRREP